MFCKLLLLFSSFLLILSIASIRKPNQIATKKEGAVLALSQIQEWAKWMAGIQTAAIAGALLIVFEDKFKGVRCLDSWLSSLALMSLFHLGAGLFCSAWLLSSLPSLSIRIYAVGALSPNTNYDVYEQPLYGWCKWPKTAYMLNLTHWFWAFGLMSLGLFVGTILLRGGYT